MKHLVPRAVLLLRGPARALMAQPPTVQIGTSHGSAVILPAMPPMHTRSDGSGRVLDRPSGPRSQPTNEREDHISKPVVVVDGFVMEASRTKPCTMVVAVASGGRRDSTRRSCSPRAIPFSWAAPTEQALDLHSNVSKAASVIRAPANLRIRCARVEVIHL
jgi:hypothetical protein